MQELANFAEYLARSGGDSVRVYFRTQVNVDSKTDGSPVTIADKNAEERMREFIMKQYPDHGIIGEEYGNSNPEAAYQWVLDPIDGTKNFIAGTPLFGTLVGLLHHGQPVIGVIYLPVLDQMMVGYDGQAWLNHTPVQVRPCDHLEDATLLSTSHWSAQQRDLAAFEALTKQVKMYRTWGDCYGYTLLASGYADIMLDPKMKIWDMAALIPIVKGAGGHITDWYGNDPIQGDSIVATAGPLHEAVIRALNP